MSAFRPLQLEPPPQAADECRAQGHPDLERPKEVTPVKTRSYRIFGSLTALSVLAAILAAPKKWG